MKVSIDYREMGRAYWRITRPVLLIAVAITFALFFYAWYAKGHPDFDTLATLLAFKFVFYVGLTAMVFGVLSLGLFVSTLFSVSFLPGRNAPRRPASDSATAETAAAALEQPMARLSSSR